MRLVKGDLLKLAEAGEFDIIIHGCNCFCTMGGGIARKIADRWPVVKNIDAKTVSGDRNKLGTYTSADVAVRGGFDKLKVINAYTQYSTSGVKDVFEYDAFIQVLASIANITNASNTKVRIGLPKIGCGLAGGNEKRIIGIIKAFSDKVAEKAEVTVVEYS